MELDIEKIASLWQEKYPECQPRAEALRATYKDRWVRFHTLPNSKRHPDNETEYKIVLDRCNTLLNDLKPADSVVVITSEWAEGQNILPKSQSDRLGLPGAIHWQAFIEDPDDPTNPNYRHLFLSIKKWQPGVLDNLLRAVANDEIGGVIVAPDNLSWLYAPYDGGIDVILSSSEDRDVLKSRHAGWLSTYPTGL